MKVGYGNVGITGSGVITSEPFEEEDWSGKGRRTFYVEFEPDALINPAAMPILDLRELKREIPDFEWRRGHSGMILSPTQSAKTDVLWKNFLEKHRSVFTKAITEKSYDCIFLRTK